MPNTNYQTIHQMGSAVNNIIRQASGRDEVQNIDMDFVTVARNHCAVHEEYSGSEISFDAHVVTPMGLIVQVNPVQDLHGYANPWPGGGGKNLINPAVFLQREGYNNLSVTVNGGTISISGYTQGGRFIGYPFKTTIGTNYYLSTSPGTNITRARISEFDSEPTNAPTDGTIANTDNGYLHTATKEWAMIVYELSSGADGGTATIIDLQVEVGTAKTSWVPYSNICPITGWTGANVTLSPTTDPDDPDKEVYAYTFPTEAGNVYGGTLTVNKDGTGTLVVDRLKKTLTNNDSFTITIATSQNRIGASFYESQGKTNGTFVSDSLKSMPNASGGFGINPWEIWGSTAAPRLWISVPSSIDTVDKFKTYLQSNPIDVVYYPATPVTYTLSSLEVINTLKGTNNVYADTGDITVQFTDILEDY